jgi:hypothetical protein
MLIPAALSSHLQELCRIRSNHTNDAAFPFEAGGSGAAEELGERRGNGICEGREGPERSRQIGAQGLAQEAIRAPKNHVSVLSDMILCEEW